MIRVGIVDDQHLVRAGFGMVLGSEADIEVVGEAADGMAAVELARREPIDVLLMDIRMPHLDGIEATRQVVDATDTKVIILTTFEADEYVLGAVRAGASGFLLKDVEPDHLVDAIRTVHAGGALLAPSATRALVAAYVDGGSVAHPVPPEVDELTEREREVLELIGHGRSNAEIAGDLHLGETTVKTHVGRVLSKLGLRDRVQVVVFAYEHGLIRPGE